MMAARNVKVVFKIWLVFIVIFAAVPLSFTQASAISNGSKPSVLTIGELPIGSKLRDSSTWDFFTASMNGTDFAEDDKRVHKTAPITWILVVRDAYTPGTSMFLSKEIIAVFEGNHTPNYNDLGGPEQWLNNRFRFAMSQSFQDAIIPSSTDPHEQYDLLNHNYFFNLSAPETGDFTDKNPYAEVKVVPPEYVTSASFNATYYMTRTSWPYLNLPKMLNSQTGKIDPVDPIQKGIRPAVNLNSNTLVAGPYTDPTDGESYYILVDGNYRGTAALESPEMSVGQVVNVRFEIMKGNATIDKDYQKAVDITISGYSPAPDGTIGTFAGMSLTGQQSTVSVQFVDGVAMVPLSLHAAQEQTLHFHINGLLLPDVELIVQPTAHAEYNVTIVQQPRGPLEEGGGQLDVQPILQVIDKYGNPLTGEMVHAIEKSNSGNWTLAGNGPIMVDEQGMAAFTALLATNESTTQDVEQAVIEFVLAGVSVAESAPFRIKKDSGKIITQMRPVPYVADNPVMDDKGGKFKKIDSNLYITKESYMDLLFELRKPEQVDIYVNGEKRASGKKINSIFQVVEGNLLSFDSVDPLLDIYKLRIRQQPVLSSKDEIKIVARSGAIGANTDTESIEFVQAPTRITLNTPQLLKSYSRVTFTGNMDVAAKLPIGITTSDGYIESIISHNDGNFSIEFIAPFVPGMMSLMVATPGMEQNVETVKNIVIYESLKMVPPYTCEGTVESALTCQLTALGGYGERTWSIISGDLPSGVTLDPRTGLLSGVPESAGTYIAEIEVSDSTIEKANVTVTMMIKPQQPDPDIEAPTWPNDSELIASDVTQTSAKLSWPSATDNVGVSDYRIYVDGKAFTTVSNSVYAATVTGLMANTHYTFKVMAFDAEGNESVGLTALVKTLPQQPDPDIEAPTWPNDSELIASDVTQTSAKLSWPSATDNVGVSDYRIYVDDKAFTTVSSSVYAATVTGLTANTHYTFKVTAHDAAGNESAPISKQATTARSSSGGSGSQGGYVLSSNADLEELHVWDEDKRLELSPSFAADTTSYTARTQAEQVRIAVKPARSAAKVLLNGKVITDSTMAHLEEGDNMLVLIVQAENGSKKEYTLNIHREIPKPSEPTIHFTDIAGHWAKSDIKRAAAKGFVSGYPNGTFQPNHPITRSEFTVMLAGALKLDSKGTAPAAFTDIDQIGTWAKQAITQAVQTGIIYGYKDGSFRPNSQLTRAEMAVMIARALKLQPNINASTGFADDESIPQWAKGAIEAVHARSIMNGRGQNRFEPNERATRVETTVILLRMLDYLEYKED
ncbi:S-layer homology domain-containing protein [Paenibacillus aquistagni]|uniref:S-layer homology domain-containing protein n=1 Tax=Paenibacillus aquistagni TaxID=1852522 RepID=UPI000B4FEDC1|nr:S-layer homology domain-containing protein [Paenibacillus aquistagni]